MRLLRKKLMNGYNVKLGQWDESHDWGNSESDLSHSRTESLLDKIAVAKYSLDERCQWKL